MSRIARTSYQNTVFPQRSNAALHRAVRATKGNPPINAQQGPGRVGKAQGVTTLLQEAMAAIATARNKQFRLLGPEGIDAEHQRVLSQPLPTEPEQAAKVLVERLGLSGSSQALVQRAMWHVLRGEGAVREQSQSIGGLQKTNPITHSTQMAVTDEGFDHLLVSLADPRMHNKAWLHVERINRVDVHGEFSPHTLPYALPPTQLLSLIRLFAGGAVPVTLFYGSPNFRPSAVGELPAGQDDAASAGFLYNPEKAVRELSYVARGAFSQGVSEVKVTMDGLSEAESVAFMRAVCRDLGSAVAPGRNYLSAAVNLNRGLVDLGVVEHPMSFTARPAAGERALLAEVAKRALRAAVDGGFGKVTLDSANMMPPSFPLIEFFGVRNLLTWVHDAHSAGKETYVSGGMQSYHFPLLALTGVDGVGVGTSIHEAGSKPGLTGRIIPGRVHDALRRRDAAEASPPGQVIYMLRQLDEQVASATITDAGRALRDALFEALATFADRVDADLDRLIATREDAFSSLRQQLSQGTLTQSEHDTQRKAAGTGYQDAFIASVDAAMRDPGFVEHCEKLAARGQALGLLRR